MLKMKTIFSEKWVDGGDETEFDYLTAD